jgi:hypothetical protein
LPFGIILLKRFSFINHQKKSIMKRPWLVLAIVAVLGIIVYFFFCSPKSKPGGPNEPFIVDWVVSPAGDPSTGVLGPRNDYKNHDEGRDMGEPSTFGNVFFGPVQGNKNQRGDKNSRATFTYNCVSEDGSNCEMLFLLAGSSNVTTESLVVTASQMPPNPQTTTSFTWPGGHSTSHTLSLPCGPVEISAEVRDLSEDPNEEGIQTPFVLQLKDLDCKKPH